MTVLNPINGQPETDISTLVNTADIPSDANKAYETPLDEDGGVSDKQGIAGDPVDLSALITANEDEPKASSSTKQLLIIGGVGLILLLVLWRMK